MTTMSDEQVIAKIEAAFSKAREAGKDEDSIKLEMIKAGSTFKTVNKDYAELLVKFGIVDSKETRDAAVASAVDGADLTTEEGFGAAVEKILSAVKGIEKNQAVMSLRAYCRKKEIPVWAKPKGEGGRTGFVVTFHDALVANPRMTKEEAADIIHGRNGHPETSENVKRQESIYQRMRKLANRIVDVVVDDEDDDDSDE